MNVPSYHSCTDIELVNYALNDVDPPAVKELCNRVIPLGSELWEVSDISLQDDLDSALATIDELREEIEDLHDELSSHLNEIDNLQEELEGLKAEAA